MVPIGCPESSVPNCHCTLRNIPDERRSHLRRDGSLKSRTDVFYLIYFFPLLLSHADYLKIGHDRFTHTPLNNYMYVSTQALP